VDQYRAIRLQAMRAVLDPDEDAEIRKIHRFISERFHVPLDMVADLDQTEVLQAYYETVYSEMTDPERDRELADLLETEEEAKARIKARDIERLDAFEFARFSAEDEKDRARRKKLSEVKKTEAPVLDPKDLKAEPDLTMRFVSAEDFEKELEGLGSLAPEEDKK
jgi:hypothetical protein